MQRQLVLEKHQSIVSALQLSQNCYSETKKNKITCNFYWVQP